MGRVRTFDTELRGRLKVSRCLHSGKGKRVGSSERDIISKGGLLGSADMTYVECHSEGIQNQDEDEFEKVGCVVG